LFLLFHLLSWFVFFLLSLSLSLSIFEKMAQGRVNYSHLLKWFIWMDVQASKEGFPTTWVSSGLCRYVNYRRRMYNDTKFQLEGLVLFADDAHLVAMSVIEPEIRWCDYKGKVDMYINPLPFAPVNPSLSARFIYGQLPDRKEYVLDEVRQLTSVTISHDDWKPRRPRPCVAVVAPSASIAQRSIQNTLVSPGGPYHGVMNAGVISHGVGKCRRVGLSRRHQAKRVDPSVSTIPVVVTIPNPLVSSACSSGSNQHVDEAMNIPRSICCVCSQLMRDS